MKRFLLTLMSMVSIILVLSVTGCCQQCDPLTGLCFKPNRDVAKYVSVSVESESIPAEPVHSMQESPEIVVETHDIVLQERRSFYSRRVRTPARSLVVGTANRLKRLCCR